MTPVSCEAGLGPPKKNRYNRKIQQSEYIDGTKSMPLLFLFNAPFDIPS
jgi:hypothetical protein